MVTFTTYHLGFRIWCSVWDFGFGFGICGSEFGIQGLEFRLHTGLVAILGREGKREHVWLLA